MNPLTKQEALAVLMAVHTRSAVLKSRIWELDAILNVLEKREDKPLAELFAVNSNIELVKQEMAALLTACEKIASVTDDSEYESLLENIQEESMGEPC